MTSVREITKLIKKYNIYISLTYLIKNDNKYKSLEVYISKSFQEKKYD